jgi:chitin disaccharide deacetylase
MSMMSKNQTSRLLGYPTESRLLIINADDFGMCNSINEAIISALNEGVVRSTSLMIACPWAVQATNFLKDHPDIPFGVHLTVICDADNYSWGPVASKESVPALVDRAGHFFSVDNFPKVIDQALVDQLETEFRAQIEAVLTLGLKPAHLDWHSLHLDSRIDVFELMFKLAREYGMAFRVTGQSYIQKVQNLGLPANDFDLLDSYTIDPVNKPARYTQMLHDLPAGLSEWAVHPGFDNSELLALEPDGFHVRQTDFDFWTSQNAKDLISEEGITLIDYRALQDIWKR